MSDLVWLIFHDSAQQVGLAILETDFMLDLALAHDRLLMPPIFDLSRQRPGDVEGDFAVRVHARQKSMFTPTSMY